ncbi:prepilin peptidase [Bradyrhizobium sp. CNPSo 4010]|uniref:Protein translocase subunit SecA n=2 Tax=Bradyrhizobium agreste TaxID=2751811 RepID=A0ABS0PZG0_9BRAD|nr:prepilin peptidase [Bradyrhizobium agreste]
MSSPGFVLPRPVLYPERRWPRPRPLDRVADAFGSMLVTRAPLRARRLRDIVVRVADEGRLLAGIPDAELQAHTQALREPLRRTQAQDPAVVARAFAVIREVSDRVLGMRHFDVQLMGGYAMLQGMVAEMDTGEGKTLTATLAAATAALAGMPVHVVTVNDYLATRDCDIMRPLYTFLGVSAGIVVHDLTPEQRQAAYACDITYCTNKDLAFDYLRDRLELGQQRGNLRRKVARLGAAPPVSLLLRGLAFAIVDEADSVLIDEARTPLILSRSLPSAISSEDVRRAIEIARSLEQGRDYLTRSNERRISLTQRGLLRVARLAEAAGGLGNGPVQCEELVCQALTALYLFNRGEHYIVRDGKVEIVDEYTGRVMADRFWSDGLHQMIELKEGCAATGARETLARMTYQRFFRRYRRLSGMSGTATEIAGELWRVYRLKVARIPTHRPSRRVQVADRVLPNETTKWQAITTTIAGLTARGLPVLLGTRSVLASQRASEYLHSAGLDHVVLNAAQDSAEAEIVAAAGQPGRITVATNMAGRGTDIKVPEDVCVRGGLHVIISERHDSRRIDRQLVGRCARQGQPGWCQSILSAEDALFDMDPSGIMRMLVRLGLVIGSQRLAAIAIRGAQWKAERLHSRMRGALLNSDERLDHALAFAGKAE